MAWAYRTVVIKNTAGTKGGLATRERRADDLNAVDAFCADATKLLNEAGKAGWELVSVVHLAWGPEYFDFDKIAVMKRPE